MITRKKLIKHVSVLLILSVFCYFLAFLIFSLGQKYYSPDSVTKRLKSEIAGAISDLDNELDKTQNFHFQNKIQFREYFDSKYKNLFEKEGIEILLYRNDTLLCWSNNVFAAPFIKDNQYFKSPVIRNGSGYYLARQKQIQNYTLVALQLVRYKYKYQNEYLPSEFHSKFSAPRTAEVLIQKGKHVITDPEGKYLFSLNFEQPFTLSVWLQYLIFTLYVSGFLFLVAAGYLLYMFAMRDFGQKWFLFLIFVADVIILRAIQFYFKFPSSLYELQPFNPAYFASSELFPSLGDFLINSLITLQLVYLAYKNTIFSRYLLDPQYRNLKLLALFIAILALTYVLNLFISILVLDSTISFRFENVLGLSYLSHVGMLILATILFSVLMIFDFIGSQVFELMKSKKLFLLFAFSGLLVYSVFSYFTSGFDLFHLLFLLILFSILMIKSINKGVKKLNITRLILLAVVLSAFATYLLNKAEIRREREKRKLLTIQLSNARDNLAEFYYKDAVKTIQQDKRIQSVLSKEQPEAILKETSDYIKAKYFSGYWTKYLVQVTICQPAKKLNIMPGNIVTDCELYFNEKVNQYMQAVSVPGLFFLRQSVDMMYYLGKIKIQSDDVNMGYQTNIFIEISANDTWKGLGYPELLIDKNTLGAENFSNYSYAFYSKGELVKNVGKFSYNIDNEDIKTQKIKNDYFISRGYSHFVYKADANTMIVVSREVHRISDLISPFSYIFILLMLLLLFVNGISGFTLGWEAEIHTFRIRLQLIMIAVIVVSSILLVTVSLLFINMLNSNKNNEILGEKLNSVLIDLESRYGNFSSLNEIPQTELSDLLINQSNTYFTDVNLFSTKGLLLASSREQIFKEGMIAEQMSPSSIRQLMSEKKSVIIEKENIGKYSFLSAYTPLRNIDNKLLGYVNLPYFAKQEEIRLRISSLISTFANIYIIMIAITVLLALLLSRYITRPLQHIGNQFSMVKIGDKNAKIKWTRKDEIGSLVNEYNRMIDEMERSTELLARSERESAWRQMARQVAHEIKNPLTPIKLNMQLLMRAWNDKAPDWEIRLKRFSQTLIMQIDTLSSIATEFSDFAQMPEPQIGEFDVIPLIQQSAALFRDQSDCDIDFNSNYDECLIMADQNQILRVFNNLIKNALQAIPGDRKGQIKIELIKNDSFCTISFQDNGTGIPTERQTRIFSPNFTTKTAGMGLGLAMVKNIIDGSSGRIWFETDPGEGTTFYVSLPLNDQKASNQ